MMLTPRDAFLDMQIPDAWHAEYTAFIVYWKKRIEVAAAHRASTAKQTKTKRNLLKEAELDQHAFVYLWEGWYERAKLDKGATRPEGKVDPGVVQRSGADGSGDRGAEDPQAGLA